MDSFFFFKLKLIRRFEIFIIFIAVRKWKKELGRAETSGRS